MPADITALTTQTVLDTHCGQIDTATAARMALAQAARDQFMARAVEQHAPRGVLLLAGNGHVRRDVGVPRWLTAATRQRTEAIGMLERATASGGTSDSAADAAAYDRREYSPPQTRADPCLAFKAPAH